MSARRLWSSLSFFGAVPLIALAGWMFRGREGAFAGVSITAVPSWAPQRAPNTTGWTATFWIKNTTVASRLFTFACDASFSPPITCTGLTLTSATIPAGDSVQVNATYNVGAFGGNANGYVGINAENLTPAPGAVGYSTQNIPVGTSGALAAVTPDAGAVSRAPFLNYAETFTVQNLASFPVTYDISASCTGAGLQPGCTPGATSVVLSGAGLGSDSKTVTVNYQTKANGTSGTITLSALVAGVVKDNGTINVTVGGTGGTQVAPQVNIVDLNGGTTIARGLCLTVGLGSGAAAECGDLRLAHGLQALKTYGAARAPALLYGSQTAEPVGQVAAHVTLPAGAKFPTWVEAVLKVGGVKKDSVRFAGNEWIEQRPRRIIVRDTTPGMAEGVYNYTLEVATIYGVTRLPAATLNGSFVIVNRRTSPYGMGWWVAGVERLSVASKLWIGGDGSTRVYQATANPNKWVAPSVDRVDTLELNGAEYWRYLPAKGKIVFDATGRHIRTENRLGFATSFAYDGSGRIDSIVAPVPAGGTAPRWKFTYAAGKITISDRLTATPRLVNVYLNAAARVDSITDPDTSKVALGYLNSTSGLVTSRTDRRGKVRNFTVDAYRHVTGMSAVPGFSMATINLGIKPLESRGLICGVSPCSVDAALAYTHLDGPRTDVGDTTVYFLDKYGAPKQIVDALAGVTKLDRLDPLWPGLVTRAAYPNGRVTKATYNSRGNVASTIDSTATVKGLAAVVTTSYAYAATGCPDAVSSITLPGQNGPTFNYDTGNCNRLWERDGSLNQTTYTYYTTGAPNKLLATVQSPGVVGVDSVIYDVQGNLAASRSPMAFRSTFTNDGYGRDSVAVTPTDSLQTVGLKQTATNIYDRRGRLKQTLVVGPTTSYTTPGTGVVITLPGVTTTTTSVYDREGNLLDHLASATPDSTGVDIQSIYSYDDVGRKRTQRAGGAMTTYTYDAASNLTIQQTGRTYQLVRQYDALNRLLNAITPQVDYAASSCVGADCRYAFPRYPNNGSGLRLAADTARFTYDGVGNILTANNTYAQVKRSYTKSGWLETDSLRVRTYTGAVQFNTHKYGVTIRYDSLGRRRVLKHPTNLYNVEALATRDSAIARYNIGTGALAEVVDLRGQQYIYTDDAAGRQIRLETRPSVGGAVGVKEEWTFDNDSRIKNRKVFQLGSGTPTLQASYGLDARGKQTVSQYTGLYLEQNNTTNYHYAGQGGLVASFSTYTTPTEQRFEEFRADGFDNQYFTRTTNEPGAPQPQRSTYDDLHARLTKRVGTVPVPLTATSRYPDTTALSYDGSGNVHLKTTHTYRGGNTTQVATWSYERHYYGADDKLRVVQRMALGAYGPDLSSTFLTAPSSGAWEEYWYDALGRRVLARERRVDLSTETYRRDVIDRFMWDGDQLLYELRQPGGAADNLDTSPYGGTSRFYGTVGYIHGRDLDRPLALHDSAGRVPIVDARGQYEGFLRPTGAGADCKTAAGAGCWTISWASKRTGAGFQTWGGSYPDVPDEWRGGLIQNQTDRAGLAYKRNRYYDPSTGRFTQVDPIGIAGGTNVYGFANGDPVNFSDPFGLDPCSSLRSTTVAAMLMCESLNFASSVSGRHGFAEMAGSTPPSPVGSSLIGETSSGIGRKIRSGQRLEASNFINSGKAAQPNSLKGLGRVGPAAEGASELRGLGGGVLAGLALLFAPDDQPYDNKACAVERCEARPTTPLERAPTMSARYPGDRPTP